MLATGLNQDGVQLLLILLLLFRLVFVHILLDSHQHRMLIRCCALFLYARSTSVSKQKSCACKCIRPCGTFSRSSCNKGVLNPRSRHNSLQGTVYKYRALTNCANGPRSQARLAMHMFGLNVNYDCLGHYVLSLAHL